MSARTTRGRGRPAGSKTHGADVREGLPNGKNSMPSRAEVARMAALATLARVFPAIFRTMKDEEIATLERTLEQAIDGALRRLEE